WQAAGLPPLGLEHESFDLIYAVSVFTHLADESLPWLIELHRLLKPGGRLIATYMGEWNSEWFAKEPWEPDRIGMNVLFKDRSWDVGGPAVLMSEWWVREHWGRLFQIDEIEPQFHNFAWASMTKRDVKLTSKEVLAPSEDPREIAALKHNIVQLQREVVSELEYEKELGHKRLQDLECHYERLLAQRDQHIAELQRSSSARLRRLARQLLSRMA
ncbi:MAG: class I SAM-dependent methyltransferase, partial [Solirubrobacterales bacterium]|nr:class I SAM-dependent methyltransferase [Solirubrobacterales bacterium]